MTDPMQIAAATAFVIGAIATAAVTIIRALGEVRHEQRSNAVRVDSIAKDTEAIKGHVNSEKTAADGRLAAKEQEIQLLREMLADKKVTAALLAQAASHPHLTPVPVEVVNTDAAPVPVVPKVGL